MSETWNTLQVARDARLDGRADVAARLYDEVAPDFVLGRCTSSRRGHALINWDSLEWDDGPLWFAPSLMRDAWWKPLPPSPVAVAMRDCADGIEMRLTSYAQLILPQWYGVFTGDV